MGLLGGGGGGGDSHLAFALSGAMIPQKTLFLYLLTYIFFTIWHLRN